MTLLFTWLAEKFGISLFKLVLILAIIAAIAIAVLSFIHAQRRIGEERERARQEQQDAAAAKQSQSLREKLKRMCRDTPTRNECVLDGWTRDK